MNTLTVRLPAPLGTEIEAESRQRNFQSELVRERLQRGSKQRRRAAPLAFIADLIGSVDSLPTDLTARKKKYLHTTGYGEKHPR